MSYFYEGFYASCISSFHLLFIVALGIISMKMKFVTNRFTKSLSRAITFIILPCFIFAQIIRNFRLSQSMFIIHSLVGCSSLYLIGYIVGYLCALVLGYNSNRRRFMGATFSSVHTASIPIILLSILGPVLDEIIPRPPGSTTAADSRGFFYVVLNTIFSNVWRWSGVYYLVQPEQEEVSTTCNAPEGYAMLNDTTVTAKQVQLPPKDEYTIRKFFSEVMNAPVVASLVSICLTALPGFQENINEPGSLLNSSLLSVCLMASKAYAFLVMFLLGLSLSNALTTDETALSKVVFSGWELVFISICKLVVMPIVATVPVVYICRYVLGADDILLFLFLLMSSIPSAINMIVVCTLRGAYAESISMLMIAMYGIGLITLTIGTTCIIALLGYLNPLVPVPVAPVAV